MTNKTPKMSSLDILDEISHQAALADAEDGSSNAEDRRWSRELGVKLDARMAELRRNLTPVDAPTEQAKPLRASTISMTRDALLAAIATLARSMGGQIQYAHRNLKGLTDDDLRRLFDTIDPNARDAE